MDRNDFDLLCKIVKIIDKDEYTNSIRIKDISGEVWQVSIKKSKYPHLRQGQIVRIRSAGVKDGDLKELELRYHSNILSFINGAKLEERLMKDISDSDEMGNNISADEEFARSPFLITNVGKDYENMKLTTFLDLMHNEEFEHEEAQDKEMKVDRESEEEHEDSKKEIDEKIEQSDSEEENKSKSKSKNEYPMKSNSKKESTKKSSKKKDSPIEEVKSKIKSDPSF
jgi:hypothetical protein